MSQPTEQGCSAWGPQTNSRLPGQQNPDSLHQVPKGSLSHKSSTTILHESTHTASYTSTCCSFQGLLVCASSKHTHTHAATKCPPCRPQPRHRLPDRLCSKAARVTPRS